MKTLQMVHFKEAPQLFQERCDSYSSERATAMRIEWTVNERGLTLTRRDQTSEGGVRTIREFVPWENIRQLRTIIETSAAEAKLDAAKPPGK